MSDFENLMSELGVAPLKKDKKRNKDKKTIKSVDKKEKTIIFENDNSKNKEKDDFTTFEEALKIYTPKMEENESFHLREKNEKTVFFERFSEIDIEYIMHTIDLHGKTLEEAQNIVKSRIIWCYKERFEHIMIITGKGKHSDNGPVLKIGVKKILTDMPELIEYIEYAPRHLGGEGAYIVKIKL